MNKGQDAPLRVGKLRTIFWRGCATPKAASRGAHRNAQRIRTSILAARGDQEQEASDGFASVYRLTESSSLYKGPARSKACVQEQRANAVQIFLGIGHDANFVALFVRLGTFPKTLFILESYATSLFEEARQFLRGPASRRPGHR